MNMITFPLEPRMQGPAVGDLLDALILVLERGLILGDDDGGRRDLSAALQRERLEQTYGAATRRAVAAFQTERQLEPTGTVDEKTADAFNALLLEIGEAPPSAPAGRFVVTGHVRRDDDLAAAGWRVRAFHENGDAAVRLGEDTVDAQGRYTIPYDLVPGTRSVNLRVSVGDERGLLTHSSDVIRGAQPLQVVDLQVPVGAKPAAARRLSGRVTLTHGSPAAKVTMRLYRREFGGGATRLAETVTGDDGNYALPFAAGGAAALEVRAVDPAGREVPLTQGLHDLEAGDRVEVNLTAPAAVQPLAPEYRRLVADLTPHIGDVKALAEARENADRQDLTVLNRTTGWDARLIALAAQASELAGDPGVGLSHETVYGLLRSGLPSDKRQLAQVTAETVGRALAKANSTGIVEMSDADIAAARTQFEAFSRDTRLSVATPGSTATYADLLKSAGIGDAARTKFASVYLNHRGDTTELWNKAKAEGVTAKEVEALQRQGKLAFLTVNNPALIDRLHTTQGIKDPVDLVSHEFYEAATWTAEIKALAGEDPQKLEALIPPAYVAERVEDRLATYAADMARKVRNAFPTHVTARVLENDAADPFQLGPARGATAIFMKSAAQKGFKLGTTPVRAFLKANPDAMAGVPAQDRQAATASASTLQRVYQITPSNSAMTTLMSLGLTSAYDVVTMSEDVFMDRYAHRFASRDEARLVHRKSGQVSSVIYNLFTIAKKVENDAPVYGLSAPPAVKAAVKDELIKQFPTMESLFGSMDFCECDHCRSVLSPAAYLVDLLQFVDPEPLTWGNLLADWKRTHGGIEYGSKYKKPFDALIERRADLPHIPLTCANTHTAMPYIDLVNEILEYYVWKGKLEAAAVHDTGTATSAELLAEPQNIIAAAYDTLRTGRYPLTLPFDLWLETVRRFCDHFETPLWQLLETLRPGDELLVPGQTYDRAAVFMESLRLSPADVAIFTDATALNRWHELYGWSSAAEATNAATDASGQRVDLNAAKALSRRLGVTYKELVEIVRTGFVNPKLTALVILYKLDLSVQDVMFYRAARPFFDQMKDLLGADRATLSAADRLRFDALTPDQWARLGDVAAFEQRLTDLTARVPPPGLDVRDWLNTSLANDTFDDILVLADPDAGCDLDQTILRYADGTDADPLAFLRINLFVRLWRRLGWTIEETDRALQTFIPADIPFTPANLAAQPLGTALIHIAHLEALARRIPVGKHSRLKLFTLWSPITTTGKASLYAQLFLTRSVLKNDPLFDDPLGRYLSDPAILMKDHIVALQGALGMTADDIERVLNDAGENSATVSLSVPSVSLLYRHRLLANALKLTIHELIALKQLSGLDPFKPLAATPLAQLQDDAPFVHTLAFVDVVEQVKATGFKVEDLEYLLRHRFDAKGRYRPDTPSALALLKTLSAGIRAIRSAHQVPADAGGMSDDTLRQKLGLALPSDVVDRFLAMLNNTVEFTATRTGVAVADRLDPQRLSDASIREVTYNAARQEQKLTFRGVLFDAQKNDLAGRLPAPLAPAPFAASAVFTALLDDVQAQSRAFFEKHLRKGAANVQPIAGFLEPADFDLLFSPAPAGLTETEQQTRIRGQRTRLAVAFFPVLQQRLIRQFVVDTLTAELGADAGQVALLVTDTALIGDPNPLLMALEGAGARGLTATFFAAADATGASLTTAIADHADTSLKNAAGASLMPAAARSVRFEGYLEVPMPGAYRFHLVMDKQNAEGDLRFDHISGAFLAGAAAADGGEISEFVELRAGVPYRFQVTVRKLNGGGARLLVQGETLPKDHVGQLALYPEANILRALDALVRIRKVLQIVQTLLLSERELRYFAAHRADFSNVDFGALPASPSQDTAAGARTLFAAFMRLAAYARMKREVAGGSDDLISIFEAADLETAYGLIAAMTGRDKAIVQSTAARLFAAPAFKTEVPLQRLWDALQLVERFGVPVGSMIDWLRIVSPAATPEQRFAIARGLREAIKARFTPDTWQRVAQPIFDALRQRQRDALAAYVMQQHGFARIEQLYEYFLIDPGMEPVVQTSRIRLAIGSLQLFIQRCLLNLEKDVPPAVLNGKEWEWMKRYRVWEANRKIFLFPENWLEPEFRDDKTHLFAELEGSLLQGDVSSDLVEDAFLNYLQKLDELARLDIVGMHVEDSPYPSLRTLHVIGRTHAAPRKYFYRRYAHQMWTPWEPISAKIEGEHLAPVVWRDRLYLFWVTFSFRAVPPPGNLSINPNAPIPMPAVLRYVDMQLHWTQHMNGEWSTPAFGDPVMVERTIILPETAKGPGSGAVQLGAFITLPLTVGADFDPAAVFVHVKKEPYENGEERGVFVHLGGAIQRSIYLAGRNSTPRASWYAPTPANPYSATQPLANRYAGFGPLKVTFKQRITTEAGKPPQQPAETPSILAQGDRFVILPCDNDILLGAPEPSALDAADPAAVAAAIQSGLPEIASLIKPFFYQDDATTLFVEPNVEERTVEEWTDWVLPAPKPETGFDLPDWWDDLVVVPDIPFKKPKPVGPEDLFPPDDGRIIPVRTEDDWLINAGTAVLFGGEVIGPSGLAGLTVLPADRAAVAVAEGATAIDIHAGSALASGSGVVTVGTRALGPDGARLRGGALKIVGGAGLNSGLLNSLDRNFS